MLRAVLAPLASSLLVCALAACDGDATTGGGAGAGGAGGGSGGTAGVGGAGGDAGGGGAAPIDKAANCVSSEAELGVSLTDGFGRLDGTVLAVVKPSDTQCYLPNSDHLVLQVLWAGEAYRMVVNVQSSFGDPDVFYLVTPNVPAGAPWQEGWHPGATLDYVADLGLSSGDFSQLALAPLSDAIADEITLGQKVSVYALVEGFPSSAHQIHRNGGGEDGAIVLDPDSPSPRALVFHFANQTF